MENAELDLARRYVEQTGVSVFLTGKAGTGKTTFLRQVAAECPKRHVVVAPTGVAAVNAGGVTIHSFFQLPFDPYLPDVKELVTEYQLPESHKALSRSKVDIIRTLELLIIDEISMVRADLLDAVDMTLRRYRRSSRPFGGVQLLMIGDVHQLPPVVTERERLYMERVYPSPFFFHSKALQRMPYVTIELTHVYRQQDTAFVALLNRVRDNQLDAATLNMLNSRVVPQTIKQSSGQAITLTTHNHQSDAINSRHMAALKGARRTLEAVVSGNFPDSMMPIERTLEVKVGERVMYVKNDTSGAHRYYNGKLGTVTDFVEEDGNLYVEVTDDDGDTVRVGRETWENLKYSVDGKDNSIVQEVEGTFVQYPLRAAWAVTIHKAQGLTFDHVAVNAADAFAFGQVYVALSRCRSLEGLVLTTPLSASAGIGDADVQRFCDAQPAWEEVEGAVSQYERQYYYEQLCDLFGMEGLLADTERLSQAYGPVAKLYPKKAASMKGLRDTMVDLTSVGERFRNQLMRLPQEQHAERVGKGSAYYAAQLTAFASALTVLLEVEVDNKEVAKQIKEAGDTLTESVGLKLACMKKVEAEGFSVAAVQRVKSDYLIGGKQKSRGRKAASVGKEMRDDSPNEQLMELLRLWRKAKAEEMGRPVYVVLQQKALLAIAREKPRTAKELLSLPGIGKRTVEQYGAEILDIVADCAEEEKDWWGTIKNWWGTIKKGKTS